MVDEFVRTTPDPDPTLFSLAARVDDCCDRFEAEWKAGKSPRIEDLLSAWQGDQAMLLAELLPIEIELRQRSGPEPRIDEFLQRFPGYEQIVRFAVNSAETIERSDIRTETTGLASHQRELHVRCPKCRTSVAAGGTQGDEFSCPACQSEFRLANLSDAASGRIITPKRIAHFELIEQLGVGGFGAVWKVRDTMLDRIAAIKIPRQAQVDTQGIEKFLREARAVAQLKHLNIVGVHEVGRDGEVAYIVSDYIAGSSLDHWLLNQRLPRIAAASLCQKIASALHHAHESGIIHRDLKPSNIMIDHAGEPHVMDFGLAKREAVETTMTMEGQILGTPAYMAPEQARGESHLADRRADVYGLGVILYELLTGERPFRGGLQMVLKQVLDDSPMPPRKLDPSIERDLETICLKCLEKEPQRRYATADELAQELGRFLAKEPVLARPLGKTEQVWRWCRRSPAEALLFGAVAFVMLQFLVLNFILVPWLGSTGVESMISFSQGITNAGILGATMGGFVALLRCRIRRVGLSLWPRHIIVGALIGFLIFAGAALVFEEFSVWAKEKYQNLKGKSIS